MEGSVFPPCCLTWGQTMGGGGVMKITATSFKRSAGTWHSVSLTLRQATTDPRLHWRLLDTQGQVWASLLWGHFSFLLGVHKVLFVPSKSQFSQSCVSCGSSMVGSVVTSSKRAYSIPLWQAAADLFLHTLVLRRRSDSVSVGSPGVHEVMFEPSQCLWRVWGLILSAISPLLPSSWDFSFALGSGVSFLVGSNILLLIVVQLCVVILEFLQEKMSAHPSTSLSWIYSMQ